MNRKLGLLALLGALLLSVPPVWAVGEFYAVTVGVGSGTPITSVPYTIKQSGFYYLKGNLTVTGMGITVDVDNVTLDLMGFCLSGEGTGYGVYSYNRNNVEVRNGTVRNFDIGIRLVNGIGNRINKITVSNNSDTGIYSGGDNSTVTITGCLSHSNVKYGYNIRSSGVIICNVAFNNDTGFWFNNSSSQLVDRNSSYGNHGVNWNGIVGCTIGINTPQTE